MQRPHRARARAVLPVVDHEAHGPVSALMRLARWLGARRRAPAAKID